MQNTFASHVVQTTRNRCKYTRKISDKQEKWRKSAQNPSFFCYFVVLCAKLQEISVVFARNSQVATARLLVNTVNAHADYSTHYIRRPTGHCGYWKDPLNPPKGGLPKRHALQSSTDFCDCAHFFCKQKRQFALPSTFFRIFLTIKAGFSKILRIFAAEKTIKIGTILPNFLKKSGVRFPDSPDYV